jgi:hypothetical protein
MTYSSNKLKKLQRYVKTGTTARRNIKNKKPNKFEQSLYNILIKENIKFEREYQIPGTSNFYDAYLPEWINDKTHKNFYNILLEFDGDYWHPETLVEAKTKIQKRNYRNDRYKDKLAKSKGYILLRIRQSENIQSIKKLLNDKIN